MQMVGTYCRWMIPGLLPFVISLVATKVRAMSVCAALPNLMG